MSSIGSVSTQPVSNQESRPVQPEESKESKSSSTETRQTSDDAVVANLRSRNEIRTEDELDSALSSLTRNIRRAGISSVEAHQERPAEAAQALLR